MYAGTTVYFALRVRNLSHDMAAVYTNVVSLFLDVQACYISSIAQTGSSTNSTCPGLQDVSDLAGPSHLPPQYCAGTAALTINVSLPVHVSVVPVVSWPRDRLQAVLGNAILCWRASVLWPRNRMIPITLGSLVLATCGALLGYRPPCVRVLHAYYHGDTKLLVSPTLMPHATAPKRRTR